MTTCKRSSNVLYVYCNTLGTCVYSSTLVTPRSYRTSCVVSIARKLLLLAFYSSDFLLAVQRGA